MPTNIGFRVTGMYFGAKDSVTQEIRVDVQKPNPTVYDVMIEVVKKVQMGAVPGVSTFIFDPAFPSESDSLKSFTVVYDGAPKVPYNAGVYFLQENKMVNPIYVFQYYIFDSSLIQKNNNNKTKNFNEPPDVPIVDNDIIVWRQVAIMQGANGQNKVLSDAKKAINGLRDGGAI
jgi:hypothetical protein